MDARPGQFQNRYKRNWRQQKCGSFGECCESQDCKEIFETVLREAKTTQSLINIIRKCKETFFGYVMRREKLEHLVTTGMIEGENSMKRYVKWTNKVAQSRKIDRSTERDKRCVEGHTLKSMAPD